MKHLLFAAVISALLASSFPASAAVKTQPAPAGEPLSKDFTLAAGGKAAPVYLARVLGIDPEARKKYRGVETEALMQTAFASFDMDSPTEVKVVSAAPVEKAVVRPLSKGITPTVQGNVITFKIAQPGQYVLELNGDWKQALQVFANPPEKDVPNPHDPNVIYFGPGIHEVETVVVPSGKTLYLADGAILYSTYTKGKSDTRPVVMVDGDNIRVRGRGIIDASKCPFHTRSLMTVHGKNIEIEGITVRDTTIWSVPVGGAENVKFTNFKLFGWCGNSDGIDITSSRNVTVEKSYLRTADDLVVVKACTPAVPLKSSLDRALQYTPCGKESRDVLVKECVLWNDLAHALSLGAEMSKDVDNIRFTDCDVVHDLGREWVLRIFQSDSGRVSNVRFDNIRIEECRRLASVWIGKVNWSTDLERGHIDNTLFENIKVLEGNPAVELTGFDAEHAVKGVTFKNVVVKGAALNAQQIKSNAFVSDVKVQP